MFRPHMIRQFFNKACALLVTWLLLPIPAFSLSTAKEIGPVDEILSTDIPSVTRSTWNRSGSWRCHESFVEQAGWVVLDVATPTGSPLPRLEVLDSEVLDSSPGIGSAGAIYSFSSRSTSGGILAIRRPGYLYICLRAWDPSQELGAYKLSSRFLASDLAWQGRFLSTVVIEDPEEDEPDLDPLTDSSCEPSQWLHREMSTMVGNVQMDHQDIQVEDPEEDEPDLDPFTGTGTEQAPIARLCRPDEGDDHGDFMLCGTSIELGAVATGQIHNDWGDDQDTFRFQVQHNDGSAIATIRRLCPPAGSFRRPGPSLEFRSGGRLGQLPSLDLAPGNLCLATEGVAP